MNAHLINQFIKKLKADPENNANRNQFHEQYEWIEAYLDERYDNNHIDKFSKEFGDFYWSLDEIKQVAHEFAFYPAVGSSKLGFEPNLTVKRATYHLLYFSGIVDAEFPNIDGQKEIGAEWKNKNSFNALFTIIKQIRDNLFHGKKIEIQEEQYQRNKELIALAARFTEIVLDRLEDAENKL